MKLSQLYSLVQNMQALAGAADPDVRFYAHRNCVVEGPKDSPTFIEFEIAGVTPLTDHVIASFDPAVIPQAGDFSLPLVAVPFYK